MILIEIKDLKDPVAAIYNDRSETKLYRYYEPEPGLFIAETPIVIERALAAGYEPVSMLGEARAVKANERLIQNLRDDIPVYVCSEEVFAGIAGHILTKGLMCAMRRRPNKSPEEICIGAERIVLLEEVQNPTNTGAIFRAAAALGIDAVLLTKGCSDPLYRRASRVSMGNVFCIPWGYFGEDLPPAGRIEWLKSRGFYCAAMALDDKAVPLGSEDLSKHERLAVIMGNESSGLKEETIRSCDISVMIPMQKGVDSLNVAAAAAVAFWEMRKK